jgi:coniferyl-aldehyde dehydrogenase
MPSDQEEKLESLLERQRAAFTASRPEALAIRRDRLKRLIALLRENGDALADAMSEDFGHRSREQSMITDILSTVSFAQYCLDNLEAWSKGDKRKVILPLRVLRAKAKVRYEPKGVIGIMSPWNFPVNLSLGPLAQVLAAGNRAILKPSELTPQTSALTGDLIARYFTPEEVAVVTGGPDVAAAFSALPFDHLVFTGSTETGRKVMEAAAKHLVPVTLELGGKSPVVLGRSADFETAGKRIAAGKMMNAGQICLAPDYLLVPEDKEEDAIAAIGDAARTMYPTVLHNDDYSSIVSDRHFERLRGLVEDAKAKGAEVVEINPANEDFASGNARKMPLTIVRGATGEMDVMREEIFGPILPVRTYRDISGAIAEINGRDRPLGLYYFGQDTGEQAEVLDRTISGGVTVNDVVYHVAMEDLPFGGIGPSGMGSYHGVEGFREFSHARSVFTQSKVDLAGLAGLVPPYGERTKKAIASRLK